MPEYWIRYSAMCQCYWVMFGNDEDDSYMVVEDDFPTKAAAQSYIDSVVVL